MTLLKLFKKPKKKCYPKVKTAITDRTELENTQESEMLTSIKHLNIMLESPWYTEYRRYITKNQKTISEGACIALTSGDFNGVEEYVQALYYEQVVCPLIYGYTEYTRRYNTIFYPFDNADIWLLQILALENYDLSGGLFIDIMRTGIDDNSIVYFEHTLVPFYERFEKFRYLEILKGERNHIEVMNAYYKCKRKVSILNPSKSSKLPATEDLLNYTGMDAGYKNFINCNRDLISDIYANIIKKDNLSHMNLCEVIIELYDMLIIKHLLRIADTNKIICLTEDNMTDYTLALMDICLPMNLCWIPDDQTEKEILYKFKEAYHMENTKNSVSKKFKDRVLDAAFGDSRKYIASIEEELANKVYDNTVIINGSIENKFTLEKTVDDIKGCVMDMMDHSNIGVMSMRSRYADAGVPAVDVIAEEIDPWELILHVSLPVFEKSARISNTEELHTLLLEELDKYKSAYCKKRYGSLSNTSDDDWDPVVKEWEEFRGTGLFLIVNQFLHIFGWALCYNPDTKQVKPGRVRYRGFSEGSVTRAYEKVQRYMIDNAQELYDESDYDNQDE